MKPMEIVYNLTSDDDSSCLSPGTMPGGIHQNYLSVVKTDNGQNKCRIVFSLSSQKDIQTFQYYGCAQYLVLK
jgi:hypothetical protein